MCFHVLYLVARYSFPSIRCLSVRKTFHTNFKRGKHDTPSAIAWPSCQIECVITYLKARYVSKWFFNTSDMFRGLNMNRYPNVVSVTTGTKYDRYQAAKSTISWSYYIKCLLARYTNSSMERTWYWEDILKESVTWGVGACVSNLLGIVNEKSKFRSKINWLFGNEVGW